MCNKVHDIAIVTKKKKPDVWLTKVSILWYVPLFSKSTLRFAYIL